MVNFKILLENNSTAVYKPGQVVKGLDLLINGIATCKWSDYEHNDNPYLHQDHRLIKYEGKEIYLNHKKCLFRGPGADTVEMYNGTYCYDFEFQLPHQLPSSLETSCGHIRYVIEAVLDAPWRFDKKTQLEFVVVRNVDLNFQPELKFPSQSEETKQFCCCLCKSNPLMITATIPKAGYTPGQNINVTVKYDNKSNYVVKRTNIYLVRNIHHNSTSPTSRKFIETKKLVKTTDDGVKGCEESSLELTLKVPNIMISSNVQNSKIIQVCYELMIEAEIKGLHKNIKFSIPIVIGTVPLLMDGAVVQEYPADSYRNTTISHN